MTNEQRLEAKRTDLSSIIKTIEDDFKENLVMVDGQQIERKLNEQPPSDVEESLKYLYYKLPDTDSVIVTDSEVFVLLKRYLALDGDFSYEEIYRMKLN